MWAGLTGVGESGRPDGKSAASTFEPTLSSDEVDPVAKFGNAIYNVVMVNGDSAASLLRDLRRRQGHTLRSAAAELGVAPSQLSRMERGERAVGEAAALRLSEYYDVPAEVISLAQGQLPPDIVSILREHPEELERLRSKYSA